MKTVIINLPDKHTSLFLSLFKKFKFSTHILSKKEKEEMAMAEWIDEGMKSEEVSEKAIFDTLKKHGVKI